jgi:hypothetical protein
LRSHKGLIVNVNPALSGFKQYPFLLIIGSIFLDLNVRIDRNELLQEKQTHRHTDTQTNICLNYSCSYLEYIDMLEILKYLALKPTGNEDG